MTEVDVQLAERYQHVQQQVAQACARAGRSESDVNLIVVSKFHPASLVLNLMRLGQRSFGENKDQEAKPKFEQVVAELQSNPQLAGLGLPDVHFVGQLQSNKAKSVIRYANTIHSLDRESLLTALGNAISNGAIANEAGPNGRASAVRGPIGVFIELNLTDDLGRGGIAPADLLPFAEQVLNTGGLNLLGVMGVAGLDVAPEHDFERIAEASRNLQNLAPEAKFISAGMSGDFEAAIAFGATHLRIGTAITGQRNYLA